MFRYTAEYIPGARLKRKFPLPRRGAGLLFVLLYLAASACGPAPLPAEVAQALPGVQVGQEGRALRLYREGTPFLVKGACVVGTTHLPALAQAGGNTIRTYPGDDLAAILDLADSLNLAVIATLDVPPARYGIDYRDAGQRANIKAHVLEQVRQYRTHPALLMWGLGNEVHFMSDQTDAVFAFVNELAEAVHAADSLHPTTYGINGVDLFRRLYRACPALDIVSINDFHSFARIQRLSRYAGWLIRKPILVSEWAPMGYWAGPTTAWSAPIELSGAEKGARYRDIYQTYLAGDDALMLGSCVFFWGHKHEQTHTWFSFFTETGAPTHLVRDMQAVWSDQPVSPPGTRLAAIAIAPRDTGERDIYLQAGSWYTAEAILAGPAADSLTYSWEISPEYVRERLTGGDAEIRPTPVLRVTGKVHDPILRFQAPDSTGAYRIFAYATHASGYVSMTNVPIYVMAPAQLTP